MLLFTYRANSSKRSFAFGMNWHYYINIIKADFPLEFCFHCSISLYIFLFIIICLSRYDDLSLPYFSRFDEIIVGYFSRFDDFLCCKDTKKCLKLFTEVFCFFFIKA